MGNRIPRRVNMEILRMRWGRDNVAPSATRDFSTRSETILEKVPRSLRLSVRVALAMSFLTAVPRPVRAGYDWLPATRRSFPSHLPRLRSVPRQSWSPAHHLAAPARPDLVREQHHGLSC